MLDEVSRIQNAAIMSTDEEMAELLTGIEANRELVKRLTARATPFTVPACAARAKIDANRIVGVCGNDDHVVGLLSVLDSYHIKVRMPVLMAPIFDDSTAHAEDYQEWKSLVFQLRRCNVWMQRIKAKMVEG